MDINEIRKFSATDMSEVEIQLRGDAHKGIIASVPGTSRKWITISCIEFDWDGIKWQVDDIHTPVDFTLLCNILKDIEELYEEWAQEIAWNN